MKVLHKKNYMTVIKFVLLLHLHLKELNIWFCVLFLLEPEWIGTEWRENWSDVLCDDVLA